MRRSPDLDTPDLITAWLLGHLTKGEGMRRPYHRKFENGGCSPKFSLRNWRTDPVATLGAGLSTLCRPVLGTDTGVIIQMAASSIRVSANLCLPDRPPSEYLVQILGRPVNYVGDSPEVVIELLRGFDAPPSPFAATELIEVGFPGHEQDELTYVGCWQWGVHGEARGSEFVARAAAATLAAIEEASSKDPAWQTPT